MSLKTRIQQDMKDAMRAGDKARLGTIRLILAAIKQKEVDERKDLDDADLTVVLDKMVKQRRESISHFDKAGRNDLIEQEAAELTVIQAYLPEPLDEGQLNTLIDEALAQTGASSLKDMGKVMAWLKPRLQGRADMSAVSSRIKKRLV
jgi:uncharacterized protein YqeY